MYKIKSYSFTQAKKLGVTIKPSIRAGKKIDIFDKKGNYICSIGASGYSDYPTYIQDEGKAYADERRRLYKLRHTEKKTKGTPSYFADNILW